ncbi:MAG TPA: ATP-binding protein [Chloroflexota bacterium]|nr:ATP-binding protein [Chloroflexota bacterium]
MSAYQLLQLMSQVLFVFITLVVTFRTVRRPLKTNVDTVLLFATIALIVAISWVDQVLGLNPGRVVSAATSSLLMALPYMLVRLVDDFTAPRRAIPRTAAVGLAAAVVSLWVLAPPYPGILVLLCVLYFVGFTCYVAGAFVKAARRSSGVTQRRMQAVAAGSLFLGTVILLAGISAATPSLSNGEGVVMTILGLLSGLFFFLGFAPPVWLRRAWQEPEVRAFLDRAASLPRMPDREAIVHELEQGAASSLGASNAVIGLWDAESGFMQYNLSRIPRELLPDQMIAGRAFITQEPVFSDNAERDDPEHAEVYRRSGARAILAAPISSGEKRLGVLAIYAAHSPIFADDDLLLVSLLANQAAVILESRALIDEAARVKALEEAARLKDDFLSAAAHDLKTPLTTMVAQAQLLERRARRNPTEPPNLEGIEALVKESLRLKRLVLELLDVARVEQGKLVNHREPVDLVELAREACARHSTTLHRYMLDAPGRLVEKYDSMRIMQLIDNLLENAAKYSPAGGDVCVRIRQDGASALLTVMDPGIGIPAADLLLLFDRFHRGSNVDDRRFSGMGLGLFICRGIVEQHGGSIWATSTGIGQGSTFHVVLPASGPINLASRQNPSSIDVEQTG